MRKKQYLLLTMMAVSLLNGHYLLAQTQRSSNGFDSFDSDDQNGRTFNPFDNDSTKQHKEIPKGIYVWTVDQKFGDIKRVDVDTMPHLYPQTTLAMGRQMQYNTLGNTWRTDYDQWWCSWCRIYDPYPWWFITVCIQRPSDRYRWSAHQLNRYFWW